VGVVCVSMGYMDFNAKVARLCGMKERCSLWFLPDHTFSTIESSIAVRLDLRSMDDVNSVLRTSADDLRYVEVIDNSKVWPPEVWYCSESRNKDDNYEFNMSAMDMCGMMLSGPLVLSFDEKAPRLCPKFQVSTSGDT
jgi:hypothetical protein